jgi:hypothetical protein
MADPRGRQPIGLEQPPGSGTNYPFVSPSDDIKHLLGDLFLSFDDLADTVVYPLRVSWLYGFGTDVVTPPTGVPTPTHSHDIVIVDANNVVVFNSTLATRFTATPWDNRLLILEWTGSSVLRCTMHTAWTPADIASNRTRTYANHIEPDDGELQADTWFKMPKRVLSVRIGNTKMQATQLTFAGGYNIELATETDAAAGIEFTTFGDTKSLVAGDRTSHRISLSAEPGSGLGVFPGCADPAATIRTINKVQGSSHQNFTFETEGCIRTQRPVGIVTTSPRVLDCSAEGLTPTNAASTISLANNCKNCCDCTYFAQTYQGLKRQWFLYGETAQAAEQARDLYAANKTRWLANKALREADTLRVRVAIDGSSKLSWGVAHANASKCCLYGVTLQLTWLYYVNNVLAIPAMTTYDCNKTKIEGSEQCDGPESISGTTSANGLLTLINWNHSKPQSNTTVYGRHCFADAVNLAPDTLKVRLHAVIWWNNADNDPSNNQACNYNTLQSSDFDSDVLATWASYGIDVPTNGHAQQLSPRVSVTASSPYCDSCQCT